MGYMVLLLMLLIFVGNKANNIVSSCRMLLTFHTYSYNYDTNVSNISHGVSKMVHQNNDIRVELYNISHNCSLCGYYMCRMSESVCEMLDYSDTHSKTFDTKSSILVCKDCSIRRRKQNIRVYADKRFAELSVELAVITELRRDFSRFDTNVAPPKKPAPVSPVPNTPTASEIDALWDEPEPVSPPPNAPAKMTHTAVAGLDRNDSRLDPESPLFDAELYSRWLDL